MVSDVRGLLTTRELEARPLHRRDEYWTSTTHGAMFPMNTSNRIAVSPVHEWFEQVLWQQFRQIRQTEHLLDRPLHRTELASGVASHACDQCARASFDSAGTLRSLPRHHLIRQTLVSVGRWEADRGHTAPEPGDIDRHKA